MSDSESTKNTPPPADPFIEHTNWTPEELLHQREGLPQDYRMRHEEHYVDELVTSTGSPQIRHVSVTDIEGPSSTTDEQLAHLVDSIREFGMLQPLLVRRDGGRYQLLAGAKRLSAAIRAGLTEVPCLLHEVDEVEARRVAEAANRRAPRAPVQVASPPRFWSPAAAGLVDASLGTILSTLGLLSEPTRPLRDRVAIGLIRAEAQRASRLLRGLRVLNAEPVLVRDEIDVDQLLYDAISLSEEERGLLGIELSLTSGDSFSVRADTELVSVALAGAVDAILALLRSSRGAALAVRLHRNEFTRLIQLDVSEDAVRMPTAAWSRWLDMEWKERPGGYAAGVGLLAAKRVAELHGGSLEMTPTDTGGCRLTLTLAANT